MSVIRSSFLVTPLAVAMAIVLGGCSNQQSPPPKEEFAPDNSSRPVWQAMDRQAALGAKKDATLFSDDFEEAQLSSLGRWHLSEMMKEPPAPPVVYVDLNPQDPITAARREAVSQYLKQIDSSSQARVEIGANWARSAPAAENIKRLPKTENGRAGEKWTDTDSGQQGMSTGTPSGGGG